MSFLASLESIGNSIWQFLSKMLYAITAHTQPNSMLITALIIIVFTGMIGGIVAKKLKQPLILGYILAGVFVGIVYKASFGEAANLSLDSLANIGVALLLFSMGLEFSKSDIRPIFKIAVWGSLTQVVLTLFTGAALAYFLSKYTDVLDSVPAMFMFGTAFVSTSTAVILKTLNSKGRMGTLSSKVMIGMSIVQDLTVIPLMLIVGKLGNIGAGGDSIMNTIKPLLLGAVFMLLMMTVGAKWIPKLLQAVAKLNSKELFMLAITGIALGAGFLSDAMQVSFSFGAFLVGIVLSDSEYGKKALSELGPVRDLFAMLFFVSIGMMLDCNYLLENFGLVVLLLFLTSFSRSFMLAVVTWCSGYRNIIPFAMLFGMIPTSEIAFVVIQSAKNDGIFSGDAYSLVLCITVCSMIVGPALDYLTTPAYALARKYLYRNGPISNDVTMPPPQLSNHILIAGGGVMARFIAKLLSALHYPYVIVESDYNAFQMARKENLTVLYGDPQSEVILNSAGIEHARLMLAAADGFTENLAAIRTARHLNQNISIVTAADLQDEMDMLQEYQITEIVQPEFEGRLEMMRQVLISLKMSALEVQNYLDEVRHHRYRELLLEQQGDYSTLQRIKSFLGLIELYWIQLPENSPLVGATIAQSGIRTRTGSSVAGILRGENFLTNPGPADVLKSGDILAMIGNREQRCAFERIAGHESADSPEGAKHIGHEADDENA